jgi:hypothetical protein
LFWISTMKRAGSPQRFARNRRRPRWAGKPGTDRRAHPDPRALRSGVEQNDHRRRHADPNSLSSFPVDLYANDVADPSGFGEGQRPIGTTLATQFTSSVHFRFEADGDLTGQFITATWTRVNNAFGFAKPEGIDQNLLTQTPEFSRAIEVR